MRYIAYCGKYILIQPTKKIMKDINQVIETLKTALTQKWERRKTIRCPRLKTMASMINEHLSNYEASVTYGNVLTIYKKNTRDRVLRHNPSDAYRTNYEVAEWILENI